MVYEIGKPPVRKSSLKEREESSSLEIEEEQASEQGFTVEVSSGPTDYPSDTDSTVGVSWNPDLVLKLTSKFDAAFANMETNKMHTFPEGLPHFLEQYGAQVTVPNGARIRTTAPSKLMARAKIVATHHFMLDTKFPSFHEMYEDFCSAVGDMRNFRVPTYYDILLGYTRDALKFVMLRDGCFLLQYMLRCTIGPDKMPQSLVCYFDSNRASINRDIMLLENQLPWIVIQTLRSYKEVPVEDFVAKMAHTLQVRKGIGDEKPFVAYTPPHLLGLLRFYKLGTSSKVEATSNQSKRFSLINYCCYRNSSGLPLSDGTIRPMSRTISAMELAEIGIKLTASKTTKFMDMGFKKGLFCSEIFLAPLLLDETKLCWLVNMAEFERSIAAATFSSITDETYAVCSYLVVLAMLMDREEDVHRLRSKGLVNGELTNKETLDFFKGLVKHISGGALYIRLMEEIEDYKIKRWIWIKVHKFVYRNWRTIAAVLSIVGVLVGIFKTLLSLKQH